MTTPDLQEELTAATPATPPNAAAPASPAVDRKSVV